MNYDDRYIIIPNAVFDDQELSHFEKLLYGLLISYTNNGKKYCYATDRTIAERSGMKMRSVSGGIASLKRRGYIRVEISTMPNRIIQRRIFTDHIVSKEAKRAENDAEFADFCASGNAKNCGESNIILSNINTKSGSKKNRAIPTPENVFKSLQTDPEYSRKVRLEDVQDAYAFWTSVNWEYKGTRIPEGMRWAKIRMSAISRAAKREKESASQYRPLGEDQ